MKDELSKSQRHLIATKVFSALKIHDLKEWHRVCKSFAPPHYATTTRKKWAKDNQWRLEIAREIVDFIDSWTETFRNHEKFADVKKSIIRKEIIESVRREQAKQTSLKSNVNEVKLSGFRSLIKWTDNTEMLEEGPYGGKEKLPDKKIVRTLSRRGRKRLKGKFKAPEIDMGTKTIVRKDGRIRLRMAMINNYIHPYQNVKLEVNTDKGLEIVGVSPYEWTPEDQSIHVGFVPASLTAEPLNTEFSIELLTTGTSEEYNLSATIYYDNTDKGKREKTEEIDRRVRVR
jgi:hypothetical protein